MKKDIFLIINSESMKHLFELYQFTSNWDYSKQERELYREDLGKIETKNCIFRFIKHINVNEVQRFFLSKPEKEEMKDTSIEEFVDDLMELEK